MSKIALVTDTHAGCRNSRKEFADHQQRFFENVFFPTLRKHDVRHILHLGDMFDKPEYINISALNRFRQYFINPLIADDYSLTVICGNHDAHKKSTNRINTPLEILPTTATVIWDRPEIVNIENVRFGLVPWMNKENVDSCLQFIEGQSSHVDVLVGHFEIAGFPFHRGGMVSEHGLNSEMFWKYPAVWSGHYHTKSQKGNILYLGTSMQFTWNDYDDQKGFHLFDTETKELEYIPNPDKMFFRLDYHDSPITVTENIEDRCVRLVVYKKENTVAFQKTLAAIRELNPMELQVVDKTTVDPSGATVEDADIKTTTQVFHEYVDATSGLDDGKKAGIKLILSEAYMEVSR